MTPETRLGGRRVYAGRVLDVHLDRVRLPTGSTVELEIIRHPGASAVVPLHEDRTVTLIRQYRYAAGGFILEAPAGKLDGGEAPEACARRELREEAGLHAERFVSLGAILTTPGFTDEVIHLFAATGLSPAEQALEHDEVIEVQRMPLEKAMELAQSGEIADGKSLCALFRLERALAEGKVRA